jgi:hypothetical protein
VTYHEVIEAGEHLPGMAALWDVATVEERYEMVTIILEPGGLYYDLENKIVAALKPRPAFLPVLRMLNGVMEFDETRGLLVTEHWCDRNRRASDYLQDDQRDGQTNKTCDAFPERNFASILMDSCWDFHPAIPRHQQCRGGQHQHRQRWVLALDWLTYTDVEQAHKRVVLHHKHVGDASDRGRLRHDKDQ